MHRLTRQRTPGKDAVGYRRSALNSVAFVERQDDEVMLKIVDGKHSVVKGSQSETVREPPSLTHGNVRFIVGDAYCLAKCIE
jgi:hypothetical protein